MIVYVANDLVQMTGGSQAAQDIAIALAATEHPLIIVSNNQSALPADNNKAFSLSRWIVPIKTVPFPKRISKHWLKQVAGWAKRKWLNFWQKKYFQKLHPNLIVVNSFGSHLLWEQIKPQLNGKTILIIHESPRHFLPPSKYTVEWALKAMNQYNAFIFVSSTCRDEWLSLGNFKDKNAYYIPNCCKEEKVSNLIAQERDRVRQRLGIPADKFIAVCVASLQPRKNQNLLIEIFPDLLKIVPNLKLYLIGPIAFDLKWANSLLQQVKENGFDESIEYLGAREDAIDFIYTADLFLLPSLAEAMPLVILEAMALKTPVIASDVDGIPELLEHEVTGLLFSPKQPQSFINAFRQMCASAERRKQMSETAHDKYWAEFSKSEYIERYQKVIQEEAILVK